MLKGKRMRLLMTVAGLAMASGMAMTVTPSFAAPIEPNRTYSLINHQDGSGQPPLYGLRLDGLFNGDSNQIVTFDFNENPASDVNLVWDGGDQVTISGTVFGGIDIGDQYDSDNSGTWDLNFSYSGIAVDGDFLVVEGETGTGTITSLGTGNEDLGDYYLFAESNGDFSFKIGSNSRCGGCLAGWGWLNHNDENVDAPHIYYSDFLFEIDSSSTPSSDVPEPGTLALLTAGLFGLGLAAHRRRLPIRG